MDELLLTDKEIMANYVQDGEFATGRRCAQAQLSKAHKHYATKIEEAKVRGLEAGKILGAKEEADYIIKCITDCK